MSSTFLVSRIIIPITPRNGGGRRSVEPYCHCHLRHGSLCLQTESGANRKYNKQEKHIFLESLVPLRSWTFLRRLPKRSHCVSNRLTCLCEGQMWRGRWRKKKTNTLMGCLNAPTATSRNCSAFHVRPTSWVLIYKLPGDTNYEQGFLLCDITGINVFNLSKGHNSARAAAGLQDEKWKTSGTACWQQGLQNKHFFSHCQWVGSCMNCLHVEHWNCTKYLHISLCAWPNLPQPNLVNIVFSEEDITSICTLLGFWGLDLGELSYKSNYK